MIRLPSSSRRGEWTLAGLLRSRRVALGACVLTAALLVAQSARAIITHSREETLRARIASVATPERDHADVQAIADGITGAAEFQCSVPKTLPAEQQPGAVLERLIEVLSAAGIDTYRYRVLAADAASPESDGPRSPIEDRPIISPNATNEEERWNGEGLVPLELDGTELPPPPPGVQKWDLALSVCASYAQLIQAMRLLETDGRIWDVPRATVRHGQTGTEADLRLITYTRPPAAGRGASGGIDTLTVKTEPIARVPAPDPFGEQIHRGSSPVPPRLGAIRLGAGEAAWLNGGPVRPGERAGDWTLLSVEPGVAWVQHVRGAKVCLRLDEAPKKDRKESSDAQP